MASPSRGIEVRRTEVVWVEDVQAKVTSVTGKVTIGPGPGEAVFNVPFPVWFAEEPNFSFGWQLYPNQGLTQGAFPTANAGVVEWETAEPDGVDNGRKFWIGATIAVVTTGPEGQRLYIHVRAEGVAIRNPVNRTSDLTADDTV